MKFLLRQHNEYMRDEQPYRFLPIQIIHFVITARPDRPSLQAVRQDIQRSQLRGAGVRFGLWLCHTPVFMVTIKCYVFPQEKKNWYLVYWRYDDSSHEDGNEVLFALSARQVVAGTHMCEGQHVN